MKTNNKFEYNEEDEFIFFFCNHAFTAIATDLYNMIL